MKLLLDIKDSKADFLLELLQSFPFVKTETLTQSKAQFLLDLKGATHEVGLAKEGNSKLQSARDFLDEL